MNKKIQLFPVIMAGGSGTRLWPLSRELYPKQFLKLFDSVSMIQATINRLNYLNVEIPEIIIVCSEKHQYIVNEQLQKISNKIKKIILEPVSRNTAPAITLAALQVIEINESALLLVLAADHLIDDTESFCKQIENSIHYALKGELVTFGIVPSAPETGYGYIRKGGKVDDKNGYKVTNFVEKPDIVTAESYLACGDYYWNSGMFLFKASSYLVELSKYRPDILNKCQEAITLSIQHDEFVHVNAEKLSQCPSESIDYAVMEHTEKAIVVPLNVGWNDIGSWQALWEVGDKDKNGNLLYGDVICLNTKNSYIRAENKLLATIAVTDLVIIETGDAILISNKNNTQDVRLVFDYLVKNNRIESQTSQVTHYIWGNKESIYSNNDISVKLLTITPKKKIHIENSKLTTKNWLVTKGEAKVFYDNTDIIFKKNEIITISKLKPNYIENNTEEDLIIIEVDVD